MAYCGCYVDEDNEFKPTLKERLERSVRQEDWEYLSDHPEIRTILQMFLRGVFKEQPACVDDFAAEFSKSLRAKYAGKMD